MIDASVAVAAALRLDSNYFAANAWWISAFRGHELLLAPWILAAELGGAIRRVTGDSAAAKAVVERVLGNARLTLHPVDSGLARTAASLAIAHSLKGCDAIYVALAVDRGEPLVTLDREQAQRARTVVTVIVPG